jgi:hypothetical protein
MSFLDALKTNALNVLHATVNALHAQFAASLAQAGHDVNADTHVNDLVQTAVTAGAATGKPAGTATPNYADHALATFSQSMTAAMLAFAQSHLPAKFQPVGEEAAQVANDVVSAAATGTHVDAAAVGDTVTKVAASAITAAVPGAAPIVAVAEPIIESLEHAFEGGRSAGEEMETVAQQAAPVVETAAATAATELAGTATAELSKVVPADTASALVGAGEALISSFVHPSSESAPDKTPAPNTQGV